MISFENTEVAFRSKSNSDLRKAYMLFKMVGNHRLVSFGKWITNIALKSHIPIRKTIKRTIFKQFCGGESIDECDPVIKLLAKYNIGTILDYSVEGKTKPEDFDKTCEEICQTIRKAAKNDHIPFAVFKVTGITRFGLLEKCNDSTADLTPKEKKEFKNLHDRVDKICKLGFESNTPVFIDAEESWIQNTIDRLTTSMMAKYNKEKAIVFNTFQLYRHDRLAFLKESNEEAKKNGYYLGVKLVRGAYMEKERERAQEMGYPSPIQKDKISSDKDFDGAVQYCIENIENISTCIGTHNEDSSQKSIKLMDQYKVSKDDKRIYFAQLLGMSDHISYNLSAAGYNVAKYVPYGPVKEVLPYLIRRAEENTSMSGQTSRELTLISKELERRKSE